MAKNDDRVSMPSGMGGLVRYFDEYKSKVKFSPEQVIIAAGVIIAGLIILHVVG